MKMHSFLTLKLGLLVKFDLSSLFSQAVKACIHHSASLCESVLRVGAFSWPVDVSASHIAQLQFAAAVKNILDTEGQPVCGINVILTAFGLQNQYESTHFQHDNK